MLNINYYAEPTCSRFHRSNAFVRGIRGPIGSGKSVACCIEIVRRAIEQTAFEGVRRSRWAVIRNTYPELKTTTIKTWQDWVSETHAPIVWGSPITSNLTLNLADGTRVECEVLFLALDKPDDVKKLKSLDLTGIWMNEACELPKAVLDMATGRVGRYPSKVMGGSAWSGVIMDTNPPDDDHWWYKLAEGTDAEALAMQEELKSQMVELGLMDAMDEFQAFFSQPPALLKQDGKYIPNPLAENVRNHSLGIGYYLRQVVGKTEEWIKVFIMGQYGSVHDGKPVYPEYNDNLHCAPTRPIFGKKLDIGLDFGLTPAAVICQQDARGRLLQHDELCGTDMGMRQFLDNVLIPHLKKVYPSWWENKDDLILCIGDPAGQAGAQNDNEQTCFKEVKAAGLKIKAAASNDFLPRRNAVAWFLDRLHDGKPMFQMDPCCAITRKGFNGGYKYARVQVTGEERYKDEPNKNRFSHPHDGLQYIAMEYGGVEAHIKAQRKGKKDKVLPVDKSHDTEISGA